MKSLLRRSKRLRSARDFVAACREALGSPPKKIEAELEAGYADKEDRWGYATEPSERERYVAALEMLGAHELDRPSQALEIGCGEGFFTDRIAPQCGRLLAVDFSPTALERAASRCATRENVTFSRWDLVRGSILGTFDLVICMDVLEYVVRPDARRQAFKNVIGSLAPGGALLMSDVLRPPHLENAWWGKWLAAGARAWVARFSGSLTLVDERTTERHLVSLFRAR